MEEKTKPVTATPSKWEEKAAAKAKRRARREKEEAEEGKLTVRRSRKYVEDLTPLDFMIGEVKPSAGKRAHIGTYRWTDPKHIKYRQDLCVVVDRANTKLDLRNKKARDWFVCEQCRRVFIDAKPAAHRLDYEEMEDPAMVACQACIMKLDRRDKLTKHGYQLSDQMTLVVKLNAAVGLHRDEVFKCTECDGLEVVWEDWDLDSCGFSCRACITAEPK